MEFQEICDQIRPLDEKAMERAVDRWNSIAKPIGSLGRLEDYIVQIAGIIEDDEVSLDKKTVLAMCADNGVVEEGVTQTGQDITALIAGNMGKKISSVCFMSKVAGADVVPVNIGMVYEPDSENVIDRKIASGTKNMVKEPAMTRDEAVEAVQVGIDMVKDLKEQGYNIIVTGEMGIGNTTTSSAVASVLLDMSVESVTGRGAGLSSAAYNKKIQAISSAIELHKPNALDAIDVVSKVGGFDIAGLAGAFIGGALYRVPIVVDGFISAVSALVAVTICPQCKPFILASHASSEPATLAVLEKLELTPLIYAEMRLGEGTGGVCLLPLLDMVLAVYYGMSFDAIGMDAYDADLNKK